MGTTKNLLMMFTQMCIEILAITQTTMLVRGVAHDDLGCENNPVLYGVYKNVNENFADGKKKGKSRSGRVKRSGASCKGSVTSLRAKAKKYSGERGKMYHWCANMKSGKKKSK